MNNGFHVVLTGMPACGKTSILNRLVASCNAHPIPELVEWIRGRIQLPPQPMTRAEKMAKQELLLSIDIERSHAAEAAFDDGNLVVTDTDFTSALAYNAADRNRASHLDVFDWLLDRYEQALEAGNLRYPNLYIFLNTSLECRLSRRVEDGDRIRNSIFFDPVFSEQMEGYLRESLTQLAAGGTSDCAVIDADRPETVVLEDVLGTVAQHAGLQGFTLPTSCPD